MSFFINNIEKKLRYNTRSITNPSSPISTKGTSSKYIEKRGRISTKEIERKLKKKLEKLSNKVFTLLKNIEIEEKS